MWCSVANQNHSTAKHKYSTMQHSTAQHEYRKAVPYIILHYITLQVSEVQHNERKRKTFFISHVCVSTAQLHHVKPYSTRNNKNILYIKQLVQTVTIAIAEDTMNTNTKQSLHMSPQQQKKRKKNTHTVNH